MRTMRLLLHLSTALPSLGSAIGVAVAKPLTTNTHPSGGPPVVHAKHGVTYHGLARNGIEVFLGIPYGQDTSGAGRFKPPRRHVPQPGSRVDATAYGPSCPQALGEWAPPISLGNITEVSEDCLNLNVARPKGVREGDGLLPVMVYIHGGGFWAGHGHDPTILPDGLVREAVGNDGRGVVHVAMNYRLGCKSCHGGGGIVRWTVFGSAEY
jgi:carboxylesterase type B